MRISAASLATVLILGGLLSLGIGARAHAAPPLVTHIRVTERDFHISAPKQVASGNLALSVANHGPDDHELIVVRAASAHLPLRSDGLTVDEAKLRPVTEHGLEPGAPDSVRELRLELPPGRYVLFCNMSGHFMAGMHTTLVVH